VEFLFSYGTLRDENIQRAIFGRAVTTKPDAVVGYRVRTTQVSNWGNAAISGGDMQQTLEPGKGEVEGMVLAVTPEELTLADKYEPIEYRRAKAPLRSGGEAWVYLRIDKTDRSIGN
jgi:acyl-CoA thioesterase I